MSSGVSSGCSPAQRLRGQGSSGEGFGRSAAINDGIVVVGAPSEDDVWTQTADGSYLRPGGWGANGCIGQT